MMRQVIKEEKEVVKMGFFCPLRRSKRKMGGKGGGP